MSQQAKVILIIVTVVLGTVVVLAVLFFAALWFALDDPIEGWQEAPPSYLSPSP